MTKRLISTGSPMEKQAGYSRAVVQGDWVFVAGTTGFDYADMTMPESLEAQIRNCFKTIIETLEAADAKLSDVVRVNYVTTKQEYVNECFEIFGEYFGDIRPAAMIIIAGLATDDMKIEIEVTAFKG
ncbi:MAG: RidA family protein [Rhizobiales bacterium]|nr:RidA family protein [Hyphomicrobiales bacterium]NRB14027.1 RidA family protein [Hyphomicrobiales bacterium]